MQDLQNKGLSARIRQLVGPKQYDTGVFSLFNRIRIAHYMEVYLFSDSIDCGYFLRLSDNNEWESAVVQQLIENYDAVVGLWGPGF